MKIGFLGAGKVGFSLGKWFVQGGIPVTGYLAQAQRIGPGGGGVDWHKVLPTAEALVTASDAIFSPFQMERSPTVYQGLGTLT